MDLPEGREPLWVVSPEVLEDALLGVHIPRNSPMISMVRTSESESLVCLGPRLRRGSRRSWSQSSTRQKVATMKVLRSTRAWASFRFRLVWSLPSVREAPPLFKSSSKTCTRG